jgi:hypothetical protein
VSWNDQLDKGGVVVSDEVFVSLDVEAILAENPGPGVISRTLGGCRGQAPP